MNASWHSLITNTSNNSDDLISGEWFTVRFIPDHVTGEIFNIGVVFIDKYKDSYYQLLENADAFSCLFGDIGKANINFLLKVVDEVLSKNNYLITPSPHIIYSSHQTAQGDSVEEILDDLYKSMISLVCRHDDETQDNDTNSMSTKNLRSKIFRQMKDENEELYYKIYNKNPYEITNPKTKEKILVDMPINYYSGLERQRRQEYYGSVVSAAYLSDVHRIHHINYIGATNVMNCCELLGKDIRTALIIYLPPVDQYKFTKDVHEKAENELDRCLYGLQQMSKDGYQIHLEVKESPEACLKEIIEFVH